MLLGDFAHSSLNRSLFKSVKIKASVKILGIVFTYDYRIKQKMNFDELINSVKDKLLYLERKRQNQMPSAY